MTVALMQRSVKFHFTFGALDAIVFILVNKFLEFDALLLIRDTSVLLFIL